MVKGVVVILNIWAPEVVYHEDHPRLQRTQCGRRWWDQQRQTSLGIWLPRKLAVRIARPCERCEALGP